jgi:hypothetical protein
VPTTTTTTTTTRSRDVARRTGPLVGAGLIAGGVLFSVGGGMHPKEDPPDVTLYEHMRIMFGNPDWYPSHALLLAGTVLIAAALLVLVRGGSLAGVPRAQAAATAAAVGAAVAVPGMLLHLVAAVEAGAIGAGPPTPIADAQVVVETLTAPLFGLGVAWFAVVGAPTRTVGNVVTAVPGVVGGVAYALAGATILITDALDGLSPLAAGIAVWAAAAGVGLLLRRRAT